MKIFSFAALISAMLFIQSVNTYAGNEKKIISTTHHSLGLQLNPLNMESLSTDLSRFYLKGALRYSYRFSPAVTGGAEMISTYDKWGEDNFHTIGTGIFARYWFFNHSWVRLGAEINGFGVRQNLHWESTPIPGFDDDAIKQFYSDKYKFGYFVSPVISLNKPNSRWSIDLMYKLTHRQTPAYADKAIFSYRLNYHF